MKAPSKDSWLQDRYDEIERDMWKVVYLIAGIYLLGAGALVAATIDMNRDHDDKAPVVHGNHSTIKPPEARPGPPVPQRTLPGYPIERWHKLQEAAGR